MMLQSEQINELAAALAKAQAEISTASKDTKNPHFKSSYADLASIWSACRKQLTSNGISVVQAPSTNEDGSVVVTTRLLHQSGQWLESSMACRPQKQDAQGIGSVCTYLKRYSLSAMVGVAPDDDDDGEAAVGRGANGGTEMQATNSKPAPKPRQTPAQRYPAQEEAQEPYQPKQANGGEKANGETVVTVRGADGTPKRARLTAAIAWFQERCDPDKGATVGDTEKLVANNQEWLFRHAPPVLTAACRAFELPIPKDTSATDDGYYDDPLDDIGRE